MKGAVKKNISPPTGHWDERLLVAASPLLRVDELLIRLWRFRRFITTWSLSSETEKHDGLDLPTIVLSEPRGLLLFQVVRGGIELTMGLRHVAVAQTCR